MKNKARVFVKSILLQKDLNYVQLSELMNKKGYKETPDTIRTKVHRGSFSFVFLMQVCETLNLEIDIHTK